VEAVWPEATKQFNAYYGPAAPCVYLFFDDEGNRTARVSFSTQGTRAGCVVGSAGFDIALHHFVYKHLVKEFPSFVIRALTDDLPAFFTAVGDKAWHAKYEELADFLERYDTLARPLRIERHPDKGKLHLPAWAPAPHPGSRLLQLTTIVTNGVKISGGLFGTDNDVVKHGLAKVAALQPRIDGIVRLATAKNAQASLKLLGQCANKALDYYFRITPPGLSIRAAQAWDTAIRTARQQILQLSDHGDPGLPETIEDRSNALAELPTRLGGFGHTTGESLAACAYLAGVRATQFDPLLQQAQYQKAIRRFTDDAYSRLEYDLDAKIDTFPDIVKSLPPTASALENAPRSPSTRLNKTNARKIQAAISRTLQLVGRSRLRLDTHPDQIATGHVSKSGSVHYHLLTSRSQQSRMLNGSLFFRHNRVESEAFVHFARFYLGLLPLLRPFCDTEEAPDGTKRSVCAGGHDTRILLETHADHCITCPVCYGPRHAAHELINRVYGDFGKEAQMEVQINPSTDTALANEHGDKAKILFPKQTTPAARRKADQLRLAMQVAIGPNMSLRPQAMETIRQIAAECPKGHKGLRVDSIIQARSFLLWIDVGIVHTTAKSRIDAVVVFVRRLHAAEMLAGGDHTANTMSGHVSNPLMQYQRAKTAKYSPMTNAAAAQVRRGKRALPPVFRPCIFSHLGEMSPTAIKTVETITMTYKASLSNRHFEDGISDERRTAEFRMRFKDALMCANASGFGSTLAAAGLPRAGRAIVSAYDLGGLPEWEVEDVL
jgi:hypothetical protein